MKKIYCLLALLVFASCQKDDITPPDYNNLKNSDLKDSFHAKALEGLLPVNYTIDWQEAKNGYFESLGRLWKFPLSTIQPTKAIPGRPTGW